MRKVDIFKKRLLGLIKQKALFKGKITLASGEESNYYIDGRCITLSAEGAYLTAEIFLSSVKRDPPDGIGGPTLGADPICGAIAALAFLKKKKIGAFILRKTPKKHGRQRQMESPVFKKGARLVLIDDVATTGGSLADGVKLLRAYGFKVNKALVIVDRGQGAKESLAGVGCKLISIFTPQDLGL